MLTAKTANELRERLPETNIEVPSRSSGRTNEHVETYCIVRLLSSIPFQTDDFPISLSKRESPDFLLIINKREVGIELIEAITPNLAKEDALRDKGHGPETYFIRPASIHAAMKSSKELILEIEANKPTPGWYGDSVERSWAEAMAHFIDKKIETANSPKFELFKENWLLVYDNWPAPALNHDKAIPML